MTKYIKKRKINNNNGKFKYVYFKVIGSKKKRISSKEYYSFIRKKKQLGGATESVPEPEPEPEQEIIKRIVIKNETGAPIENVVSKITKADKNILRELHESGLDRASDFTKLDDIVINGIKYISYKTSRKQMAEIKKAYENSKNDDDPDKNFGNFIEYFDRNINDDPNVWRFKQKQDEKMASQGIGIYDPKGSFINPLNDRSYSQNYKDIAKFWSKLPVYSKMHELERVIKKNQVVLLRSGTGSGKTVIIPKLALHITNYGIAAKDGLSGKVAVCMPKRIIAKDAAFFAAATLDVTIGKEVGYKHKDSSIDRGEVLVSGGRISANLYKENSHNKDTKLLYATDGSLEEILKRYPALRDELGNNIYDIIIVDEVHERNIRIDYILYLMKAALILNNTIKLILMSATIDSKPYEKYFNGFTFNVYDIPGSTPKERIDIWKKPKKEGDYYTAGQDVIKDILEKGIDELDDQDLTDIEYKKIKYYKELYSDLTTEKRKSVLHVQLHDPKEVKEINDIEEIEEIEELDKKGAILMFVPGAQDFKKICRSLNEFKDNLFLNTNIYCAGLSGQMNKQDQEIRISETKYKGLPGGPWGRKVIISTPVAESSLTIEGLVYVIDSGYERTSIYDPSSYKTKVILQRCSKAQSKQRLGRVGRTKKGVAIRLYSKEQFEKFSDFPQPDITNTDCLPLIFKTIKILGDQNKSVNILQNLNYEGRNINELKGIMTETRNMNSLFISPISDAQFESAQRILDAYGCLGSQRSVDVTTATDFLDATDGFFNLRFYIINTIYTILLEYDRNFTFMDARMVAESIILDCIEDVLKIIMLSKELSIRGIDKLFNKDGLQKYPIKRKNTDPMKFSEECSEIQMKNSMFYKNLKKTFRSDIINENSDHLTLLNIYEEYFESLKKVKKIPFFDFMTPSFLQLSEDEKKTQQTKIIKKWANSLGFDIGMLSSIFGKVISSSYDIISIFKKLFKKHCIESNIDIPDIFKTENLIDFMDEWSVWFSSINKMYNEKNKIVYSQVIYDALVELKKKSQESNTAYLEYFEEGINDFTESKKSPEQSDILKTNDDNIHYLFTKGLPLKYKIIKALTDLFDLEETNQRLVEDIQILRRYITTQGDKVHLQTMLMYALYSGILDKPLKKNEEYTPNWFMKIYYTIFGQGSMKEKKSKNQLNYVKLVYKELLDTKFEQMSKNTLLESKKKRDDKILRCLLAGYHVNISQRIRDKEINDDTKPKYNNDCPGIYKTIYSNCFPRTQTEFEFIDYSPDTFVNLEPSKKKSEKYDKDYIIYQNLIGFQPYVGAKIFNNVKMISIIPRIWLTAFSGEKISKPCNLVGWD